MSEVRTSSRKTRVGLVVSVKKDIARVKTIIREQQLAGR